MRVRLMSSSQNTYFRLSISETFNFFVITLIIELILSDDHALFYSAYLWSRHTTTLYKYLHEHCLRQILIGIPNMIAIAVEGLAVSWPCGLNKSIQGSEHSISPKLKDISS
ncbi:hypothetical protein PNOK_0618400 [Pyrrhoderma noxium]|uniref:Uncharacterized protein n=1 Tax=Pyrrhoderma noxium TaxID=2282107 RepID=A0A286UDS0_9AGAM|nr:hypothetical protein PNOK_0618400 [Pyrrhoderma noxium]